MFQSIKYVSCIYDNKTNLYHYHYTLTDSDFVSYSYVSINEAGALGSSPLGVAAVRATSTAIFLIKQYENRNYNHEEVMKNLFLLNMFLLKQKFFQYNNINEVLEYQNKYLIKDYYPESNFHEKYYKDLVKYTNKMMVII